METLRVMGKRLLIMMLALAFVGSASADIYRYQNEHGRWQFTDKPPTHNEKVDLINSTDNEPSSASVPSNIRKSLFDQFKPQTPIEEATLSVVTIETVIGTGSGFFVTGQCHIVTNRHVLRPNETEAWKQQEEILKDEEKQISEIQNSLKDDQKKLRQKKQSLVEQERYIEDLPDGRDRQLEQYKYDQRLNAYNRDAVKFEDANRNFKKQNATFRKKMSAFSLDSSLAGVAQSFKVILKDASERQAQLVHISDDSDLALLQIDHCESPFLAIDLEYRPIQGNRVYSIGSPLGQRDHLTSGVITNVKEDAITIDAQVQPGNSGGPLINEQGKFIGVNTLKLAADNPNSEGFGIAIPVKLVEKELWRYL